MTQVLEPAWLSAARAKLGTREAPGTANSSTIMGWAKRLGVKVLGMVYNADSVPWCGLFVAACMDEAGIKPPAIAVRAKAWANWSKPAPLGALAPGVVLVFERAGGGHVALYVGEGVERIKGERIAVYYVLGGNQGDKVSIMAIEQSRCVAARWPAGLTYAPRPVKLAADGVPISRNEA